MESIPVDSVLVTIRIPGPIHSALVADGGPIRERALSYIAQGLGHDLADVRAQVTKARRIRRAARKAKAAMDVESTAA